MHQYHPTKSFSYACDSQQCNFNFCSLIMNCMKNILKICNSGKFEWYLVIFITYFNFELLLSSFIFDIVLYEQNEDMIRPVE